jgi:hypothetical protein
MAPRARSRLEDVDSAWKQITETANTFKYSQQLTPGQSKRVEKVAENRGRQKKTEEALKYYTFMNKILELSSNYDLLFSVTFSQTLISSTRTKILDAILERIKERLNDASIISPGLRSITACSEERRALQPLQQHTQGPASTPAHFEYTHAELDGTRSVFDEAIVKSIKELPIEQNWRAVTKAVTMRFPSSSVTNTSSCSLKLDIREENVKELGIALFNIEVNWMTDSFHVLHENGTVGIVQHSKYIHKGAMAETIGTVFGLEIISAMDECPLRHLELSKGMRITQCVSMTFTRGGGTIEMSLGLARGVEIQRKLWMKDTT